MNPSNEPRPKIHRRTIILSVVGLSVAAIAGGSLILPRMARSVRTAPLDYSFPEGLTAQGFELLPTPACTDGRDTACWKHSLHAPTDVTPAFAS